MDERTYQPELAMLQTTKEELDYIISQLRPMIMQDLKQYAVGVGEIELATTLEGITSFPAIQKLGGTVKVVEILLSTLQDNLDGLADEAKQATSAAQTAADNATAAATAASAATAEITTMKPNLVVAEEITDITEIL